MSKKISVAVLGATGYVGLELVKILINHPNVNINFLGCENVSTIKLDNFKASFKNTNLPKLNLNNKFEPSNCDIVFLALPHGISHKFVYKFFSIILEIHKYHVDFLIKYNIYKVVISEKYIENYS